MILNGFEVEFNVYDIEIAKKIEAIQDGEYDTVIPQGAKLSEIIEIKCNDVFDILDDLFGEGTSRAIFGDKVDLKLCNEVLADFLDQAKEGITEVNETINNRFNKHVPNRAQRRAQVKSKK